MTIRDKKTFVDTTPKGVGSFFVDDLLIPLSFFAALVFFGTIFYMVCLNDVARKQEREQKCLAVGGSEIMTDIDGNKVCITGRRAM